MTATSNPTSMYDPRSSDPRLALAGVKFMEEECDWLMVRAVRLARAAGYDWGRIGRLLGRSRQAVRKRFERLAPLVGPLPPELVRKGIAAKEFDQMYNALADSRRRAQYEADDDPIAW